MRNLSYLKAVPSPEDDKSVVYILNDKILKANYEADLSVLNEENFIDMEVIDKKTLKKVYKISNEDFGIVMHSTK